MYVADSVAVRKVVLATDEVTTLAGRTSGTADGIGSAAEFENATHLAWDGLAFLYVADSAGTLRQIDTATGAVTTIAGSPDLHQVVTGSLPALLNMPFGVAVLPNGDIAVADETEPSVLVLQAE